MRPKRYLIASLLCLAAMSSGRVYGNGAIVVPLTRNEYVLKDSGHSLGGLWSRLCGRPAETPGQHYVATTVVRYAIVANPRKPCFMPGFTCDEYGNCYPIHPGGRCFSSCFVDQPCHCCHHTARHLKPGSDEANCWQSLIENQLTQDCDYVYIQDPGPFARFYHRKHFDRAQ
jgi:hypothetical protein